MIALTLLLLSRVPNASPATAAPPRTPPELQQTLQRLGSAAEDLLQSTPSFTCDETATSQALHDQKVLRSVSLSGTVRTLRQPDGRMVETYAYKREHILLFLPKLPPLFVSGGFDTALSYFLPSAQPCYRYSLSPGRIDFETRSGPVSGHICREQGLKGFALLDAAGNITHIERTIPPAVAKSLKDVPFAAIDIAPVTLNGRVYPLSHHMIATQPLDYNATGRFEATYTHCHLFTSTVTIGPSSEIPAPPEPPIALRLHRRLIRLPLIDRLHPSPPCRSPPAACPPSASESAETAAQTRSHAAPTASRC